MAVWNVGMYSKSMTESSKSVLIEVLRILGSYKDYLVLTGGWAPYFILEKFGERGQHCGSVDIDFVLNPRLIDLKVYETIVQNWTNVERNYALMQLTDTVLTTVAQLHIKEVLDNPIPKLNRFELVRQMSSDNLTNTIPNLPNWINECFNKLNNFVRD